MTDKLALELIIEYPRKIGPDKYDPNMKVTANVIRSLDATGFKTGEEKMKLDDEMSDECWNLINTALAKGVEKGMLADPDKRPETHHQATQPPTYTHTGQGQQSFSQDTRGHHTGSYGPSTPRPSSEKQARYIDQLRRNGVKHHDVYADFMVQKSKSNLSDLTSNEASDLIGLLNDIKDE